MSVVAVEIVVASAVVAGVEMAMVFLVTIPIADATMHSLAPTEPFLH